MRTDVKLGLAASVLVVVFAGWYFVSNRGSQEAIPFDELKLADAKQPAKPNPLESKPNATTPARKQPPATSQPNSTTNRSNTPASPQGQSGNASPAAANRQAANQPRVNPPAQTPSSSSPPATNPSASNQQVAQRTTPAPADSAPLSAPPTQPLTSQPPVAGGEPSSAASPGETKPADSTMIADLIKVKKDADSSDRESDSATRMTGSASSPVVAAPPPTKPTTRSTMETHTVKSGETILSLARAYYGNTRYTKTLLDANPQVVDPGALPVGSVINIPDVDNEPLPVESPADRTAAASAAGTSRGAASKPPATTTDRTYKVVRGDTLYDIAQNNLNQGARWKEIYELNKGVIGSDPAALKVGQVLKLPAQ